MAAQASTCAVRRGSKYSTGLPPLTTMQQVDRQVRPKLSKLQSDQSGSDSVPGTPASENFSIAPTIRNVEALNEKTRWSGSIPSTRDINQQALPQPKESRALSVRIKTIRWNGVLAMLSGIFSQMLCWGLIMTYGTMLAFYVRYLIPGTSATLVALAGAIPPFCLLAFAILWGCLLDAGHHTALNCVAGLFLTAGLVALAFTGSDDYGSGSYWKILLASIPMGIGQSIYFLTAPHVAKTWHPQHKGLAMGITNCGAAVGGVAWPLIFDHLVENRGFREGVAALAGIAGGLSIFIAVFSRPAPDFKRRAVGDAGSLHAWWPSQAFKSKVFVIHVISMCCVYLGILTVPFFIEVWARRNRDIAVSEDTASGTGIDTTPNGPDNLSVYLLITLNGCQLPGRLFGSSICDKFKARAVHAVACFAATIIIACSWFEVESFTGGLIFAGLFGACLGVMVSLPINDVQEILGHKRTWLLGQYAGAVYTCAAPFILGGAVISGALVQNFDIWIAPGAYVVGCFVNTGVLLLIGLSLKDDTACFEMDKDAKFASMSQASTRVNSIEGTRFDIESGQRPAASAQPQHVDNCEPSLNDRVSTKDFS